MQQQQDPVVTKFRVKKPQLIKSKPPTTIDENKKDTSKLTSCLRCRKLKKKCGKQQPECSNCDRAGEQCTYVPRKQRQSKEPKQKKDLLFVEIQSVSPNIEMESTTDNNEAPTPDLPFLKRTSPMDNVVSPVIENNTLSSPPPPSYLNSIDARAPNFNSYPKQISKILITAVGIKTNSNVSIIPPIVDRELLSRIINAYFMHNHRVCPVVNKNEFLQNFNKIFDDDIASLDAYPDQYELYMILAIGSTGLERTGIIGRDKKISEYFVSMALNFVHNNLSSNDKKNLKNLILLALYSLFNPAEFITWEISGKLTRMAIHLGLNQKISDGDSKNYTIREVEMRSRLFWAVYNIDRLSSVSLGRPVAINDDDINVPFPQNLDDDFDDIIVSQLIINLRRIEGQILRRVHSVNVNNDKENCNKVLSEIRDEIEKWYLQAKSLDNNSVQNRTQHPLTFHAQVPWYSARYNHLLILLYRPSFLNPHPSQDILNLLGKACLETLSSTYKLFITKLLPLNWTTLYRFLMVCTTILYCLCKWAIDLIESKTEICYCIEIFQAFGSDWIVAKKCSEVFKKIENKLLEITLTDGHTQDMDNLSKELLGASSSYHEILNVHSADLCIDSEFMYSF
ncbi:unnamed protein product [Candida verbasci]|uniref:Zn(2)-C6 fungal-type domain-containing protein n=1 Tax=Candida verbasci TaxID=1227364 RepID=A0A9W4TV82_9ASCO|nr:unnamed protein product [Candida verbasci]